MGHQIITAMELRARLDNHDSLQLIDVRSAGEYAAGHVPHALNVPLEELEGRLMDFSSGPVAILCQSGARAQLACDILSQHHGDLLLVQGGTKSWIDSGGPVVSSTSSRWSLERQVRLGAGFLVLLGSVMTVTSAPGWVYLTMAIGAGLCFAGLTNICGMALLLAKLPWNRSAKSQGTASEVRSA